MLVSVDELRLYMGGLTPSPGLEQVMVDIIMGVQQQLETYLNRPVEYVQVREIVQSDSKGSLYLSVTPVRKVISYGVTVATDTPPTVTVTPYDIVSDSLIGDDGRVIDKIYYNSAKIISPVWGFMVPYINTTYAIEYIAGLNGQEHEDIKLAIKRVASREYAEKYVDTAGQRTGHSESTEVGDNRQVGWSSGELQSLQRFRRRIAL